MVWLCFEAGSGDKSMGLQFFGTLEKAFREQGPERANKLAQKIADRGNRIIDAVCAWRSEHGLSALPFSDGRSVRLRHSNDPCSCLTKLLLSFSG